MTKAIFILSYISRLLEFWSVNNTSTDKNFESKVLKNIRLLGEISNNWPKYLLGTNIYKTIEFCW